MITTTLASFPSPAQGVWHLSLFGLEIPIRAYAVFIIIGIIAALVLGDRRWAARGGERGVVYDIAVWAVPFGLLGGRLYHVLTDWQTYFGPSGLGFGAALRIWDGGLGIWGAVALGGVGAWIGCRRRGIPLPAFGDAIAPGIVLAQAIGRLGNYFNQELYGRPTTVPWGMDVFYRRDPSGVIDVHSLNGVSTGDVAFTVHPTFLYELLWNLVVFVALLYIDRRFKIGHGRLFALYVAGYCIGRFCVELLRDDAATHIAGIRINSFTATFVSIGAIVYFILATKGRDDPATLRGTDHETLVEEIAEELAAVAATTGVVAAATVAVREDTEESPSAAEPVPEAEVLGAEPAPEPEAEVAEVSVDAEPVEESEQPATPEPDTETTVEVVEAESEVVAEVEAEAETASEPEVEAEPALEVEPESAPELEAAEVSADAEPVEESEQPAVAEPDAEAESEVVVEAEPALEVEPESAPESEPAEVSADAEPVVESEQPVDADDLEEAEDEAIVEAEVAAPGVETETAAEVEDADLIDEDHDPVEEEDLESLDDAVAVVAANGPLSEQGEAVLAADDSGESEPEPSAEEQESDDQEPEDAPEATETVDDAPTPDAVEAAAVEVQAVEVPAVEVQAEETEQAPASEADAPDGKRRWWRRR